MQKKLVNDAEPRLKRDWEIKSARKKKIKKAEPEEHIIKAEPGVQERQLKGAQDQQKLKKVLRPTKKTEEGSKPTTI